MARRSDDLKSGPKREELEVGLDRYDGQKTSAVPRWFIEYGGWLFAAGLLVAAFGMLKLMSREGTNGIGTAPPASLVIVGTPRKVWEDGSVTAVKSVQVRIGNQGQAPAMNVQVAVVAGARRIQLQGPGEIESGKSELFSGDIQVKLKQGEDLTVSAACSNCLPSGGS
jgi:hypothetical protein